MGSLTFKEISGNSYSDFAKQFFEGKRGFNRMDLLGRILVDYCKMNGWDMDNDPRELAKAATSSVKLKKVRNNSVVMTMPEADTQSEKPVSRKSKKTSKAVVQGEVVSNTTSKQEEAPVEKPVVQEKKTEPVKEPEEKTPKDANEGTITRTDSKGLRFRMATTPDGEQVEIVDIKGLPEFFLIENKKQLEALNGKQVSYIEEHYDPEGEGYPDVNDPSIRQGVLAYTASIVLEATFI